MEEFLFWHTIGMGESLALSKPQIPHLSAKNSSPIPLLPETGPRRLWAACGKTMVVEGVLSWGRREYVCRTGLICCSGGVRLAGVVFLGGVHCIESTPVTVQLAELPVLSLPPSRQLAASSEGSILRWESPDSEPDTSGVSWRVYSCLASWSA